MMPDDPESRLARRIADHGPIPLGDYMAACNAHYYATRDPLGTAGDFVTAPEISQMFGELVGVWLADLWQRAAPSGPVHYVELGPGRGTLAADSLRVLNGARLDPRIHFVETSPTLRAAQASACPGATFHATIDTLPATGPLLVVANEFFDALPIEQHERTREGWRTRHVTTLRGAFAAIPGTADAADQVPAALADSPVGSLVETSPAGLAVAAALAARLAAQGGALLVIDYGHQRTSVGDTLQAVRAHAYADPFANPGEQDLTAHVDFDALGSALRAGGLKLCGPRAQGEWLVALGINMRAAALARSDPARAPAHAADVFAARERLVSPAQMGRLFKVLGAHAPGWPVPEGF